jgi:hypothetical protein
MHAYGRQAYEMACGRHAYEMAPYEMFEIGRVPKTSSNTWDNKLAADLMPTVARWGSAGVSPASS